MSWERFKKYFLEIDKLGFSMDVSRMNFADDFLDSMESPMEAAFEAMDALEKGGIANPDENRMVGHYWLRDASLAPSAEITQAIESSVSQINDFTAKIHSGEIKGSAGRFENILIIGIGGSALGPQFVAQALGDPIEDKMSIYFFDNTDPAGIDRTLSQLAGKLGNTLCIVISKSGGTPETRNGMLEAEHAYKKAGLDFGKHAVVVTGDGSKLHEYSKQGGWIEFFPMWDWVGGRTSELAAVGLLPAALQGLNIQAILEGAKEMDKFTRGGPVQSNPAALLAAMWYYATNGKGEKDMVILPYKDSLMLFSKYLQQLIMESLGKEKDLDGNTVYQGIAVYGNKGSTDQHAYVQQLREGVNNFFVTFIEVLTDRDGDSVDVEPGITAGDYLQGFYLGTRSALHENDRESVTITVKEANSETVGALIALYERAVGFYASLVNINAYHQPGVEAGKKAAATTLDVRKKIIGYLEMHEGKYFTADEIAQTMGMVEQTEWVYKMLEHMATNVHKSIEKEVAKPFYNTQYRYKA